MELTRDWTKIARLFLNLIEQTRNLASKCAQLFSCSLRFRVLFVRFLARHEFVHNIVHVPSRKSYRHKLN